MRYIRLRTGRVAGDVSDVFFWGSFFGFRPARREKGGEFGFEGVREGKRERERREIAVGFLTA